MNVETAVDLFSLNRDASVTEIVTPLQSDGAVIVENLASAETVQRVLADLRPQFDGVQGRSTQSGFNGYQTLRVNSVLEISRASALLIAEPTMLKVLDAILLEHCQCYQIGSTTAIEILPGETDQVLHRDDTIYPIQISGMQLQISVMWALEDFTLDNGATRVVLNSHRWLGQREPMPGDSIARAVMPAGSALFYLGSVFHGGGANQSPKPRAGLINTYSLGWLRPEVNHHIAVPVEIAQSYPERIQRLLGYESHAGMLAWHDKAEWPRDGR